MCGIFGKVGLAAPLRVDEGAFTKALNLQTHRGPDNGATLIDDRFAFGHRRLSIIDLSTDGNQPMVSEDGRAVVIFNGEIYNFKEIRAQLAAKGHRFRTSSDTEVLLHAYCEYGADCVHSLLGMFAFAIHDYRTSETFVFRDRLGIKPLYFYHTRDALTFSSEIKSILQYEGISPQLNVAAASSYLSFRYPILQDTFFDGVESLSPGSYLRIRDAEVTTHRYWHPCDAFEEQSNDRGEAYYIARLRELLASSVKYRMIADVPSGAFLSGGVDSSVLTALMAQQSDRPVKTFTIGFDEQGYNEFDYAGLVAHRYATEHKEITLSGADYLDTMVKLIGFKDAPLSVPNEVPLYLMSKELKKDITVVLSGEGADEIFGGYGRIFRATDDYSRAQPAALAALPPQDRAEFLERLCAKYAATSFSGEVDHFLNIYRYTSLGDKQRLLHPDIDVHGIESRFVDRFQSLFDELGDASYFNKMSWAFTRVHVVGLLHRVDTTTMATSVEARVPFLDHRLVEFAFTVPQHYKLHWNSDKDRFKSKLLMSDEISEKYDTPKYLLKKAYEGDLPNEVLYRRKMGFPVPLNEWFGGDFLSYAKNILLSRESKERGLFHAPAVEQWLSDERLATVHGHAQKVWMMVNLELFCRSYLESASVAR